MNETVSWGAGSVPEPRPSRADAPRFIAQGANPLLEAANPLLVMVSDIRRSTHHADPAGLRAKLVAEIRQFELRAQAVPVANETILAARYCLCTTLDEAAALTPWGQAGVWSSHTLLVTFHNESWGGEKFFQLLDKLMQSPAAHLHLLELMYFCLALGFQGRYRVHEQGASQLETVLQRLYLSLRQYGPTVAGQTGAKSGQTLTGADLGCGLRGAAAVHADVSGRKPVAQPAIGSGL